MFGARGGAGLGGIERLVITAIVRRGQTERAGEVERLTDKLMCLGEIAGAQQRQSGIVGRTRRGVRGNQILPPILEDEGVACVASLSFQVSECLDCKARLADTGARGQQHVLWASTPEG